MGINEYLQRYGLRVASHMVPSYPYPIATPIERDPMATISHDKVYEFT